MPLAFQINEVYSNASGTVQYIELIGEANNQHQWAGQSIVASGGGGADRTFTFTTNLPSSATLGKTVLVATQGFANLGSMPPDFIVPSNFLSTGAGSVSFPGMDQLSYTMLAQPGGVNSINSSLVPAFNTPRNFAGTSLSILGNPVVGTTGNDNLVGTSGNDYVAGAAGNDTLTGGAGNDTLHGGLGTDTANYASATAAVTVNLLYSVPRNTGGAGFDTLFNIENVTGSAFNDTLTGNIVSNILTGGAGNDVLAGGNGADILRGELGADVLTGNAGADRFDFDIVGHTGITPATCDRITDFVRADGDKVDLSGIDADPALADNQAFAFIGGAAFSGNATGKLRFDAASHTVYGSIDADTAAEFSILVTGIGSMVGTDFVL